MLTTQQQQIVDNVLSPSDNRIIAVEACAGSGKTFTCHEIIEAYNPKENSLYTAFNKGIVTDSQKKFGDLIKCQTIHALAYKHIKPSKPIEDFNYLTITEKIPYAEKDIIISTLDNFFRSSSTNVEEYAEAHCDNEKLQKLIVYYANKMLEGCINPTFNFMLKCLHIMLEHKEIEIDFDLFILDECLTGKTYVSTSTGNRRISSIYNDLVQGKEVRVKSFNYATKSFEYKKAKNPLISHDREVLEIKTEGLNKIQCTPNHKILTQRGWVQAANLVVGKDFVILDSPGKQKTKVILNPLQYQIMLGSYLGDGYIHKQNNFNTYRMSFTQGEKQLNYLRWKTDAFNLTESIRCIQSGYTKKWNIYQSNSTPVFILEDTPFNLVLRDLSPLGLAIWYMDDGSGTTINSSNLCKEQQEQLKILLLEKFDIKVEVRPDGKGFYGIYFNYENRDKLYEIIKPYLHEDCAYKIGKEGLIPPSICSAYECYGGNFITSITPIGEGTVYDFEVEDNHNFCVSQSKKSTKIVVHNCQDVTAVSLEIFKLVNANRKVILGDRFQNIYSFMDTVNGFELLDNLNIFKLTQSFRCNDYIAKIVETYGKQNLVPDFEFKGFDKVTKDKDFKIAYITRTNAMLIERMFKLLEDKQSFSLIRSVNEIFSLPIALLNAASGKTVFDKKYKYLEKEYGKYQSIKDKHPTMYKNYFDYIVSVTEDSMLENIIRMLMSFQQKRINIYDIKERVTNLKPNKNIILTTAHAFKGLEMDNVYIEDDLNLSVNRTISKMHDLMSRLVLKEGENIRDHLSKDQKEDLNTYYVALSRSKTGLININYI